MSSFNLETRVFNTIKQPNMNTVEQYNGLSPLKPLLPNSLAPDLTSKLAFEKRWSLLFFSVPEKFDQNKSARAGYRLQATLLESVVTTKGKYRKKCASIRNSNSTWLKQKRKKLNV